MVPLIIFKRENVEKVRTLGNKLDANKPHLYQAFKEKFNNKNSYDKFSILNNIIPSEKYYLSVVPDYLKITYSCIIFTDYTEQNNKLIEAIEYASDSYWGDFEKFNFRVNINDFTTATTVEQGQDRAIKTTLNLILNGYIIPDVLQRDLNTIVKYNDKAKIIFSVEATNNTGIFEGAIEGNRIITTDPVRLKDRATFVNGNEGGDVIGDISSTEAENRSTAIG